MNHLAAILVVLLGHQSFAVRESAHESLERLGHLAIPALIAAADSSDPERASRSRRLLTRLQIETDPTALWLGSFAGLPYADAIPEMSDCLWDARCQFRERGLEIPSGTWPEYRLATLLWLQKNGPVDQLTLSIMAWRSSVWDATGRYP